MVIFHRRQQRGGKKEKKEEESEDVGEREIELKTMEDRVPLALGHLNGRVGVERDRERVS